MEQFAIPHQLQETLDENHTLSGLVRSCIGEFGPWLRENNIKFFAEYTDHSLGHVEQVLESANELIREACRAIITPADVATLTLAALLHDSAMHLSVDGFVTLVHPESEQEIIPGFGDKSWHLLWLDFLAESRRFSGRKLMGLFGDTTPVEHPPMDAQQMTGRDLLLIGEFLRRHHHRLAHEIARFGVPGPSERRLKINRTEETDYIVDLAGVVARSHGLSIRDCYDYLHDKYASQKVIRGVHPVFIMALLRIADLLQVQSSRAPNYVSKVRGIKSPISQGEWEMHKAIKDLNTHEFAETLYVVSEPTDVKTYLRVRNLLNQIQYELDCSWTIIGEVYGFDTKFREFGLTLRRVRSNLDDLESFSKKVEYIPCHAAFEVADTDLLKLLIGPLYGNKPEIGIRELMQNSIDAVRELEAYRKTRPQLADVELTAQDGEVVVSIDDEDDGTSWVTVSDRGIGMTLETVRDYFLKAGASLRRSEIWRKTFEDEKGKSQVLRSGRFGVGALAAFLLGNEIHLSTRHVDLPEDGGIAFTAELDAEAVELRRAKRPVGTTIRVRISEEVRNRLVEDEEIWDWYYLTEPRIERIVPSRAGRLLQKYRIPSLSSTLPPGWHRIHHPDYEDVHWTYEYTAGLTCNGIKVGYYEYHRSYFSRGYGFNAPGVSVFDPNANLPLNLQRTELSVGEYPFIEELDIDVYKDFIAFLLVNVPSQSLVSPSTHRWYAYYQYPGLKWHPDIDRPWRIHCFPWFSTSNGVGFSFEPWAISTLVDRSALLFFTYRPEPHYPSFDSRLPTVGYHPTQPVFGASPSRGYNESQTGASLNYVIELASLNQERTYWLTAGGHMGRFESLELFIPESRLLVSHHVLLLFDRLKEHAQYLQYDPVIFEVKERAIEEWHNDDWVLWRFGDCPPAEFDFERFAQENPGDPLDDWPGVLAEWYFNKDRPTVEMSPLARVWNDLLGSPIIPFDKDERRQKFARAYKELAPYIKAHESMK